MQDGASEELTATPVLASPGRRRTNGRSSCCRGLLASPVLAGDTARKG